MNREDTFAHLHKSGGNCHPKEFQIPPPPPPPKREKRENGGGICKTHVALKKNTETKGFQPGVTKTLVYIIGAAIRTSVLHFCQVQDTIKIQETARKTQSESNQKQGQN